MQPPPLPCQTKRGHIDVYVFPWFSGLYQYLCCNTFIEKKKRICSHLPLHLSSDSEMSLLLPSSLVSSHKTQLGTYLADVSHIHHLLCTLSASHSVIPPSGSGVVDRQRHLPHSDHASAFSPCYWGAVASHRVVTSLGLWADQLPRLFPNHSVCRPDLQVATALEGRGLPHNPLARIP